MKISVCIPTYNQSKYLETTIRSVLEQEELPDEIIVSNDCSTDQTAALLDKLQSEIKILRVINQPVNLGISKNTDYCLRQASGEFIVRIDSDDCLLPGYLKEITDLMVAHPKAGYGHAAIQEIDKNGHYLNVRRLMRASGYQDDGSALKACVKGYRVAANIVMFRKSALEHVNFINSQIDFAEDFYLSAQISAAGFGNVYSDKVLACYRVWKDDGHVRQKRKLAELIGLDAVFSEMIEPAFIQRNWDLGIIEKSKKQMALDHSDCVGWSIYTEKEKLELQEAVLKLSNTASVRRRLHLYRRGLGGWLNAYSLAARAGKNSVKLVYSYLKGFQTAKS